MCAVTGVAVALSDHYHNGDIIIQIDLLFFRGNDNVSVGNENRYFSTYCRLSDGE